MPKMQRKPKPKPWRVRKERPEEYLGRPEFYYTEDEIKRYSGSTGVRMAQERIAERICGFLDLAGKGKILDLGCGPGYTASWIIGQGHDVIGLDLLPGMLEKASEKGIKTIKADMRRFSDKLKGQEFDAVISASALQWIKKSQGLASVAGEIFCVLKENGKCVIQFYPQSSEEMEKVLRVFRSQGLEGEAKVLNADDPRKREVYLVLRKKAEKGKKNLKSRSKPKQGD